MNDPVDKMYALEFPAPEVSHEGGPTLVVALEGYADAGTAVASSSEHLLAALDHRVVASFDNDQLIDYRSRRPQVTLDHNEITNVENLRLAMDVVRDTNGQSFLLLSGPEPDMRWEGFAEAVADLAKRYGVRQLLCLYSAPMTVPHTRPMVVSAHSNDPEILARQFGLDARIQLAGSASLFLEHALAKQGIRTAGLTAHVPHYVAASDYPLATVRLLEEVGNIAALSFPLRALEADASKVLSQIDEQVEDSHEITQVVQALEQQYDSELEKFREQNPDAILPGETGIVSGDLLGEEFEQYLAAIDEHGIAPPQSDSDEEQED
ncbi:MAG: PAC2 family protein [Corynebacterium sp.]|nr:PAC2 family protein [Corynebacterium sp.]